MQAIKILRRLYDVRALALIFLPMYFGSALSKESNQTSLVDALVEQRMEIAINHGQLAGRGADFLREKASKAQIFLIGEDHGIAQTPQFTQALFADLRKQGYEYFAAELGPISALRVAKMLSDHSMDSYAEFIRENPYSVPFFNWREEAELLQSVLTKSQRPAETLWGLDQEFILSPKLHFQRLLQVAPDAARKTIAEYANRTAGEYQTMVSSGNPSTVFLASAKSEDFERLHKVLDATKNIEAKQLLNELEQSWQIYRANFTGESYRSNLQRSQLMKKHFIESYRNAEARDKKPPRVVVKLGLFHTKRGRSFTNVYDVGDLAQELAEANGATSFHLFVLAASGTQNVYKPFGSPPSDKAKPYDPVTEMEFANIKPFLDAAASDRWSVMDLGPLRSVLDAGKFGKLDPGLAEILWGYDAVLVMPNVSAAALFE
jgi:hypothetical protein